MLILACKNICIDFYVYIESIHDVAGITDQAKYNSKLISISYWLVDSHKVHFSFTKESIVPKASIKIVSCIA